MFDGAFDVTDANNYRYTSALDISTQEVRLARDAAVDWSALTTDLLGHPMDAAADADLVWLLSFPHLSHEQLAEKLVEEDLDQEDVGVFATFDNSESAVTSAYLSEFFVLNNPFLPEEYFIDPEATWLIRVTTGTFSEAENRMLQFVSPTEASDGDRIVVTDDSTALQLEVDLRSLDAFAITEQEAYSIDWSALTVHANGTTLDLDDLDELMIARYDDRALGDLEADFVNIDRTADAIYTADVFGLDRTPLSAAVDASGAAFSAFGADSLWLLALRCSSCLNPAPPFLTVVEVAP